MTQYVLVNACHHIQKHRSLARARDDPSEDDSTRPGEDISFARGRRRRHRRRRRRRRARDERVRILDRPLHPVHLVHPAQRARTQDEARAIAIARARATGRSPFPRRTREDIFSIFPSPPPRDAWGARSREYASPRARDFRVRVVEIDFLESPLVVSPPPGCRHHRQVTRCIQTSPGDGFVYVYRSNVSHQSKNTTLAHGNNARRPRTRRKYDTAAIGGETNGHSERPTARTRGRSRWMDGRTRARARDATSDRATRGVDRAALYFLPPLPLVASSREGTEVVRHRRYRGSIPPIQYREPRARVFPRRRVEVTERARTRARGRRRRRR